MWISKLCVLAATLAASATTALVPANSSSTACNSTIMVAMATHYDGNGNGFFVSSWFTTGTCANIAGRDLRATDALDDAAFPRAIVGIQYQDTGDSDDFNIIPIGDADWTIIDEATVPPGTIVRLISESRITGIVVEN